eukprot:TRINITY_DN80161_c0_g1_i1.p1 TRINITY_DN80161_c0_g1~~TRINITY_DN80161_c0_g1_i1.p1  ORF type:complete len:568 (-),score=84.65 TRINITY_DN80161_c0_g1_i1:165-1868(-)
MGCSNSVLAKAPLPAELQAATRKYFNLGELPITLIATSQRQALEVKVVGLEHDNLLLALEAGFHSRRYWIVDATVHMNRGLFFANFCLKPQAEDFRQSITDAERAMTSACNSVDVVPLSAGNDSNGEVVQRSLSNLSMIHMPTPKFQGRPSPISKKASQIIADSQHDLRATTASQLAQTDQYAAGKGAIVRLLILREWAPGLRVALEKTIQESGLRVIMARLSMATRTARRTVKDTFWLALADNDGAEQIPAMRGDMPSWLSSIGASLQDATASASPAKHYAPHGDLEKELRLGAKDRSKQQVLPAVLQKKISELEYRVEATSWGVQFDGVQKFCGSGMAVAHSGEHVLAFATFYVFEKDTSGWKSEQHSWSSSFATLTSVAKGGAVAEFITEYAPQERCLTIFKVFLNSVLPSGKRAGVRVTAEQLAHMPVQGNEKWKGLEAVRGLHKIHLCDVVNWNTYSLMSKIGKDPDDDMEKWLLQEEAKAVGLTLADVKSKTVTEIFARTVLGRMVHGILKIWREEQIAEHAVSSVFVKLGNTQELILGEYRPIMDIYIGLECASALPTSV